MFSLKDIDLGLNSSGNFVKKNNDINENFCCVSSIPIPFKCEPDCTVICPPPPQVEVVGLDLTPLDDVLLKLCDLVEIFSAATTTVSGQTFIKEFDVQYLPVCVEENNCKIGKILKIVTNPLTCQQVDRILYESDAETLYMGEGKIVDCKEDEIISTQVIELCKQKSK